MVASDCAHVRLITTKSRCMVRDSKSANWHSLARAKTFSRIMVPGHSNSGSALPTTHSSASASPSQVSRESSDTLLANVEQCTTKKEKETAARWISVAVLVVIASAAAVVLSLPLLPFILRDTDNTGLGNSVRAYIIHRMHFCIEDSVTPLF